MRIQNMDLTELCVFMPDTKTYSFFLNEKHIYIHYIIQFLKIRDTCGLYDLRLFPLTLLSF